jgi:hypothetical protein
MGIDHVFFPFAGDSQGMPVSDKPAQMAVDVHCIQLVLEMGMYGLFSLNQRYLGPIDRVHCFHFNLLSRIACFLFQSLIYENAMLVPHWP